METQILNGVKVRDAIYNQVSSKIAALKVGEKRIPGIAFIAFTGHLPLMKYTIDLHIEAARTLGFKVTLKTLASDKTEMDMIRQVRMLNRDPEIDAIVLLQPVPERVSALKIMQSIDPDKEIEGFHPQNAIDTMVNGLRNAKYPMCLPDALSELFHSYQVVMRKGQEVVFAVDEDFIANPFRSMVLRVAASQAIPADSSCTMVGLGHPNIREICRRADLLFIITENPESLNPDWLKRGAGIVDIYSNLVKEIPSKTDPNQLIPVIRGGVDVEAVKGIAGMIAPCPGGLMPVLLAVLFRNAMLAYDNHVKKLPELVAG